MPPSDLHHSRTTLRARIGRGAFAAAVALSLGASEPNFDGVKVATGPVVLTDEPPSPPLRRLTPRHESGGAGPEARSLPSAGSVISSLAVVVLLALGSARLWKKFGPRTLSAAPREAIEVLGRCRIEARQSVYLVRLGTRILVLGSGDGRISTLSEVTDASEVDLIASQCRGDVSGPSPFSRLFEARTTSARPTTATPDDEAPEDRISRPLRSHAERRLAERVRGGLAGEEARRVG